MKFQVNYPVESAGPAPRFVEVEVEGNKQTNGVYTGEIIGGQKCTPSEVKGPTIGERVIFRKDGDEYTCY